MPHSQGLSNNPYPKSKQPILVVIFISLRSILILYSHLRLSLLKGLIPIGLPVKILITLLPFSILATYPPHLNIQDLINPDILGKQYKIWSSSLWSLLHSPFSSHLSPNIRHRTLFSNNLNLRSSLNVRDHISQPYSTTGNIIVLYILIFKFLERSREDKSVWNMHTYIHTHKPPHWSGVQRVWQLAEVRGFESRCMHLVIYFKCITRRSET